LGTENIKKYGVIGHPIEQSQSPIIHNTWISRAQLPATYEAMDVLPADLEREFIYLFDQGCQGLNVTLPHKVTVMKLLDEVDKNALAIGAVNTIYKDKDGKLCGTNTDAFGFIENLKDHGAYEKIKGKVVILGAGGAARAIVYGLIQEGAGEIILVNRTVRRAQEVKEASYKNLTVRQWGDWDECLDGCDLLVNSTSLGMKGQTALDIKLNMLPKEAAVCDIVYKPAETNLLIKAQENGNIVVPGVGMLLHQARASFHQWFGIWPDIDESLKRKLTS